MKIWLEIEKHGEERYESLTPYKHGIRRTRIKKKNYYVIAYVFNKIEFFFLRDPDGGVTDTNSFATTSGRALV